MTQAGRQRPVVNAVQPDKEAIGQGRLQLDLALQEERGHHRDVGQREQQCANDTEDQRFGHRREIFALDAAQREDREEDNQDDQHSEGSRTDYLARAGLHLSGHLLRRERAPLQSPTIEMGQDALQNHDRAIHHDTKVDRAQAHQVGRDPEAAHQDEGKQHRQGNDRGHDHAGPHIA